MFFNLFCFNCCCFVVVIFSIRVECKYAFYDYERVGILIFVRYNRKSCRHTLIYYIFIRNISKTYILSKKSFSNIILIQIFKHILYETFNCSTFSLNIYNIVTNQKIRGIQDYYSSGSTYHL